MVMVMAMVRILAGRYRGDELGPSALERLALFKRLRDNFRLIEIGKIRAQYRQRRVGEPILTTETGRQDVPDKVMHILAVQESRRFAERVIRCGEEALDDHALISGCDIREFVRVRRSEKGRSIDMPLCGAVR